MCLCGPRRSKPKTVRGLSTEPDHSGSYHQKAKGPSDVPLSLGFLCLFLLGLHFFKCCKPQWFPALGHQIPEMGRCQTLTGTRKSCRKLSSSHACPRKELLGMQQSVFCFLTISQEKWFGISPKLVSYLIFQYWKYIVWGVPFGLLSFKFGSGAFVILWFCWTHYQPKWLNFL